MQFVRILKFRIQDIFSHTNNRSPFDETLPAAIAVTMDLFKISITVTFLEVCMHHGDFLLVCIVDNNIVVKVLVYLR